MHGTDRRRRRREPLICEPLIGVAGLVATVLLAACSSPTLPVSDPSAIPSSRVEPSHELSGDARPGDGRSDEVEAPTPDELGADVVVETAGQGTPIDRRLLGTNIPAWLGPERLEAEWLRTALADAGIATVRMPGGSWSNGYDWVACELRFATGCVWDGAARPADFADLLLDTGLDGIWTVSINETAQSAAALVAYFNGEVDDATVIGVDRNGVDWGAVGDWAAVRAANVSAAPVRIELWEIGNEVFGGAPESGGEQCAPFGWEQVWTCDGTEYVVGDAVHDGYLAIRRAMLEIDPTIEIGAVGVPDPSSWSGWGAEVIDAASGEMDFYVLHGYGFDSSPSPEEAARRPAELWPEMIETARASLPPGVMVAITEYNLVSFEAADSTQSMTRAVNGLFLADTIGQLATLGVAIANHWNLANGTASNGTDYGLVAIDDGERFPQFDGMSVWGRAGEVLLPARVSSGIEDVRVYPTRRADGSLLLIMLRPASSSVEVSLEIDGLDPDADATLTSRIAESPEATAFTFRGPIDLGPPAEQLMVTLEPWSITEIEVLGG